MQPSPTALPPSVAFQKQLTDLHIRMWREQDLFHANWWILIGLVCACVAAWFWLIRRAGLKEACLYVLVAAIFSFGINEYGEELILWDYPTDIVPYFPALTSINLIILPLVFSILYQRFRTWKGFLWASLIASAAISLAIDPLLAWGRLYTLINWRYAFSLPVYFLLAVATRVITRVFVTVAAQRSTSGAGGAL